MGRKRGPGYYDEGGVWVSTGTPKRRNGGGNHRRSNYSEPMGGGDSAGNPLTVAFGEGPREGETLLGDGDRSEVNFKNSFNHDHYGSGNGPNNNGTRRGQYTGEGH